MQLKKLFATLVITAFCTLNTSSVLAQGAEGIPQDDNNQHGRLNNAENYNNGVSQNNGTQTSTPIDGGLSLLLAAGIGYGVKKAHNRRKKAREATNTHK